ncbi:TniQ family protein [Herbaspirillum sp. BH-1]|uniref:TniQ family protein n=1 Tax=Herbaspirillum sp. (strain BH-1) TaxID=2058884 RepID=UPI00130495DB|nr:TniQ family protein [Herbaspirillum sp. BH-1]
MDIKSEEDITGYVLRESTDRRQGRGFLKADGAFDPAKKPGWVLPSNLGSMTEKLGLNFREIAVNNTRVQAYEWCLNSEDASALWEHYEGRAKPGMAAKLGILGFRGRLALCPDCLEADQSSHGYTFWRRLPLMPGISACHMHQRVLMTFCDACEAGHRRLKSNWHPTMECLCGGSLKPVADLDDKGMLMSISLSSMIDKTMRGQQPSELSAEAVTKAIGYEFGAHLHGGKAADNLLAEAVYAKVGYENVRELVNFRGHTFSRLAGTRPGLGLLRCPIQLLLGVYAVFEDLDGFSVALKTANEAPPVEQMKDASSDRRLGNRARRGAKFVAWYMSLAIEERLTIKTASRRWLLETLKDNLGIIRSELYDCEGSNTPMRYLKHIEPEWLDYMVPKVNGIRWRVSTEMELVERLEELSLHIPQRQALSLKVHPMHRVSKTFLLAGIPSESTGSKALESPEILQMLDKYSETVEQRQQRITNDFCAGVRAVYPDSPYGDEHTFTNLTPASFSKRMQNGAKQCPLAALK